MEKIQKTNEEWKKILTPKQYSIMREKGTEPAFTGEYYNFYEEGIYFCAACNSQLFASETKYNSGTGWPSFNATVTKENVEEIEDKSYGMNRTEVVCGKCNSHLGHVFNDGPPPTFLRYCINSISLIFKKL